MSHVTRTLTDGSDTVTVTLDTVSISINGEERFRLDNDMIMVKFDHTSAFCGVDCCEVDGGNRTDTVYVYTHGRFSGRGQAYAVYKFELDGANRNVIVTAYDGLHVRAVRSYRYN